MKRGLLFSAVLVCVALMAASAYAVSFGLEIEYTNAFEPEGSPPWLTATFTDDGADTVKLTMDATNLVDSEFVAGWYFNIENEALLPFLVTEYQTGDSTGPAASVSRGANAFKAGNNLGDGFDIFFDFPQPAANRFGAGEIVTYLLTANGLNASLFETLNEAGNFYSAAHVQAIGPSDANSGWIATTSIKEIAEPSTLLLLWFGLLGVGTAVRKRMNR